MEECNGHEHTDHGQERPTQYYEQILSDEGIRVTAVRLLVLKAVYSRIQGAFTLQNVVDMLETADTSSVFRALTLFAEKGLLHLIDDGSGAQKYCVCHCEDHHHHRGHIHFSCNVCHKTFCLTEVPIPPVPVPQGFQVEESEYVIKGICPNCSGCAQ